MVNVAWISCPRAWALSSVQAGLQVCIAVLCTLGVFVFSRFCWQLSSLHVARNRNIALPLLISIRTIGEAFDALFLLKSKILQRRHWRLLAQSVVVLLLSVAVIVSGPIAKASTRIGIIVRPTLEHGNLANQRFNSVGYGYVQWNQTADSLNRANFPLDQLLDYMPPVSADWLYKPNEWNSTWSMACNKTNDTPITLVDTGNCSSLYEEFPVINTFFPESAKDDINTYRSYYGIYSGKKIQDGFIFITRWSDETLSSTNTTTGLTFTIASIALHNGVNDDNSDSNCILGKGPVESASYTMAACRITRSDKVSEDAVDIAYPDHGDRNMVSDAYIANYVPRMAEEAAAEVAVTKASPDSLIRFYQTYMIVKDTYAKHPVDREVSERVRVVQISSTYLAFGIILALLNIAGLINILWFWIKHADIVAETPESKIDWAVQSIMKSEGQSVGKMANAKYSVLAGSNAANPEASKKANWLRYHFENAFFGSRRGPVDDASSLTHEAGPLSTELPQRSSPPHAHQAPYSVTPYEAQFTSQETGYYGRMDSASSHQQNDHYATKGPNHGYQQVNH